MVTERATTALMVEALRDLRHEKDAQLDAQRAEIETVKHDHADKQREIDQLKAENDRSQQRLAALEAQVARLLHAADSPSSDPR
jgi:predicted  nucleic acid-binding Zn-ribbon protein